MHTAMYHTCDALCFVLGLSFLVGIFVCMPTSLPFSVLTKMNANYVSQQTSGSQRFEREM